MKCNFEKGKHSLYSLFLILSLKNIFSNKPSPSCLSIAPVCFVQNTFEVFKLILSSTSLLEEINSEASSFQLEQPISHRSTTQC